jgi:hypothetical protein
MSREIAVRNLQNLERVYLKPSLVIVLFLGDDYFEYGLYGLMLSALFYSFP